jgi:hypothetical protein
LIASRSTSPRDFDAMLDEETAHLDALLAELETRFGLDALLDELESNSFGRH